MIEEITKDRKFWIAVTLYVIVIFILNSGNINQLGVFTEYYQNIANNLLSGYGYTYDNINHAPSFYPIWGYTFLVSTDIFLGAANHLIYFLQAFMAISGIYYFYKLFDIKARYWHLPFFLPYIAMLSVKWPAAPQTYLMILYALQFKLYMKNRKYKHLILGGILLGIVVIFRTEFIIIPVFQILFLFLKPYRANWKALLSFNGFALFASFVFLLPWAIRSYEINEELSFSAYNGGMVAYISLGDLPENPWNIKPVDDCARQFIASRGVIDPFSKEGNKILNREFRSIVLNNKALFLKKCSINFFRSLTGGVYTGEYGNLWSTFAQRYELNKNLKEYPGYWKKLEALFSLSPELLIPIILEKAIQGLFIPVLLFLILYIIVRYRNLANGENRIILCFTLALLAYNLFILSAMLYEYRQMNTAYIFLLGVYLSSRKNTSLFTLKKQNQKVFL